jgi:AmmeMemoRadiSam system protein B
MSRADADGLQRALDAQLAHACGGGPTVPSRRPPANWRARRGDSQYADSGDVPGDKSAVVGYLAAAWQRHVSSRRLKLDGRIERL